MDPLKNLKQVTKEAIIMFLLYHRVSGPEFGEPRSLEWSGKKKLLKPKCDREFQVGFRAE